MAGAAGKNVVGPGSLSIETILVATDIVADGDWATIIHFGPKVFVLWAALTSKGGDLSGLFDDPGVEILTTKTVHFGG